MAVPKRTTGTETILVVEDEESLLEVARRTLVEVGYTVLTAAQGDAAILACAQHAGDLQLLLTDVVMPRMSGKVLAQRLLKTRPALKDLYMSGDTDDAIVRHGALDAGTRGLAKPFTSTDLARKVREVLDEGSARVASVADDVLGKSVLIVDDVPENAAPDRVRQASINQGEGIGNGSSE